MCHFSLQEKNLYGSFGNPFDSSGNLLIFLKLNWVGHFRNPFFDCFQNPFQVYLETNFSYCIVGLRIDFQPFWQQTSASVPIYWLKNWPFQLQALSSKMVEWAFKLPSGSTNLFQLFSAGTKNLIRNAKCNMLLLKCTWGWKCSVHSVVGGGPFIKALHWRCGCFQLRAVKEIPWWVTGYHKLNLLCKTQWGIWGWSRALKPMAPLVSNSK